MVDGDGGLATQACWCTRMPALLPVPGNESGASCYCPKCLQHVLQQQQQQIQQYPALPTSG
jgi:hypothetical protein